MGSNERGVTTESGIRQLYVAEARASQFTAQVFAGGLLSAFGHSPTIAILDFVAEAEVNPENLEKSSLKITIQAAALTVKNDISDKDRREIERTMHEEILESSSYPEIIYECSNVSVATSAERQYSVTLNGDLTMHGVTRRQAVPARVVLDGDSLRAFGTFSLRQTDYELKLAQVAGGVLKVKDEIKFSFNILARKKE
ncbi:MAG: YceI family protein [Terriglobales bacterium]|jgi:polyisoprenoid-binding protein YceI